MVERQCPYCNKDFSPAKCQPHQTVCSKPDCQRQRRASYRRSKNAADLRYHDACLQSARQWRKEHPDYWKQYRAEHPVSAERNREQQRFRDRKQRLQDLANNTSASDIKLCPATVWLLGSELHDLRNNTSAPAQVWILEALSSVKPVAGDLRNNTVLAQ